MSEHAGRGLREPVVLHSDVERPGGRPIRKDETVIAERGLYVEIWLPERRSRRRPLFFIHGELGGSWLWERYLAHFAERGWEGHAMNLRAHFWSETTDFETLTFTSYLDDAAACLARLNRPAVMIGHGLGGLLALKLSEAREHAGLVLVSPALPAALRAPVQPHELQLPAAFRRDLIGWHGLPEQLRRQNPDLTVADVIRVQHLMGAESGLARRQMLEGIPVDREALPEVPRLVIGGGQDRLYSEQDSARLARWLGAEYQPFGAHSHYGMVTGEHSHGQVAETIRRFLESHRL